MHWWDAVILGIVEGLTEFLPVSSTGHMILTNELLGYGHDTPEELKSFEIVIQFAAILAIAMVYRGKIVQMFSWRREVSAKSLSVDELIRPRLDFLHVLLGIVPSLAVAYLLREPIKELGFQTQPVLWALVAGGVYMWIAEALYDAGKIRKTAETMDEISYRQAFAIGCIQCISAVWPGFSRSGSTIAGGMLVGLSYRAAADFSFFIAIPIMAAATGYELLKNWRLFAAGTMDIGFLALGFAVSFVTAWIVVTGFLRALQKIRLKHFAWYRFALAALFYVFIMR